MIAGLKACVGQKLSAEGYFFGELWNTARITRKSHLTQR